jgi:hypothetical protein
METAVNPGQDTLAGESTEFLEKISREGQLMLACLRWPQTDPDRVLIGRLCSQSIDWGHFQFLVQHHRVEAIVARNLLKAGMGSLTGKGADCLLHLRNISDANTREALRNLGELHHIYRELKSHGISARVLKGLPLSQEIFGDFGLRMTGDIDLLVAERDVMTVDKILQGLGYQGLIQLHHLSRKRLAFYRAHWKDVAYQNPVRAFDLDLHWRLFRNREMSGSGLGAAGEHQVTFGNFQVPTLPKQHHLLYLCVHGTIDGWVYLKSLADVAAWVRTMSQTELDFLAKTAKGYDILPEFSAALILVRRLIGMDSWSSLLLSEEDRITRHIISFSRHNLLDGAFLADRWDVTSTRLFWFEFGLRRHFAYRRELLIRILFRLRMWTTFPLPDGLFALYPLISPIEWLMHRRRGQRTAAATIGPPGADVDPEA